MLSLGVELSHNSAGNAEIKTVRAAFLRASVSGIDPILA